MGCLCCPAREHHDSHPQTEGLPHRNQELDPMVLWVPSSPGCSTISWITGYNSALCAQQQHRAMESISATRGGSGTLLHLEEIICIYSLLKKVLLPLACFPSDYFSTWFCTNEQSSGSSAQAEPGPPIYLSCSSQMAFAVSSRK